MFRRLAISVFHEWRHRNPAAKHESLPTFYAAMDLNNHRHAFLLLTAIAPSLKTAS